MICPSCGSSESRKMGYSITLKEGKKPRLQCTKCGKTYYPPKIHGGLVEGLSPELQEVLRIKTKEEQR